MKINLIPFTTPNFVSMERPAGLRQDGFKTDGVSFALKEIPAEDLAALCDTFREEIFKKAGKNDPMPIIKK